LPPQESLPIKKQTNWTQMNTDFQDFKKAPYSIQTNAIPKTALIGNSESGTPPAMSPLSVPRINSPQHIAVSNAGGRNIWAQR
jgi:hypothetical protein